MSRTSSSSAAAPAGSRTCSSASCGSWRRVCASPTWSPTSRPSGSPAWAAHPAYQPLIEAGLVDFAVLDADRLGPFELVVSGPHARRRVRCAGRWSASRTTSSTPCGTTRTRSAAATCWRPTSRCRTTRTACPRASPLPTSPGRRCRAGRSRTMRRRYSTSTARPSTTRRCWCRSAASGAWTSSPASPPARAVRWSPTRATARRSSCARRRRRRWCYHGAGFSLMVNFDFLARHVRERGGLAVLPREPARSLVVAAFVAG